MRRQKKVDKDAKIEVVGGIYFILKHNDTAGGRLGFSWGIPLIE